MKYKKLFRTKNSIITNLISQKIQDTNLLYSHLMKGPKTGTGPKVGPQKSK